MAKILALLKQELTPAPGSPGITRQVAFQGNGFLVIRSLVEPGTVSGWHHHGQYFVYGYMVSGSARFESGPGGEDSISVGPGDFFYVPPRMVHRDINPSSHQAQEVLLYFQGFGPMVVNVDGPEAQ